MYAKSGACDRIAVDINREAAHAMTITIRLSDDEQRLLAERASRTGRDLADYVHLLIERDIHGPTDVDEALAPFRRQVEESRMTDEELGDFFEEVREEVWQEKHGRPSKTP
jgi:predicted DNA-binding protein